MSRQDDRPPGPMYKTRMCIKYTGPHGCKNPTCNFAHGQAELREPPRGYVPAGGGRGFPGGRGRFGDDRRGALPRLSTLPSLSCFYLPASQTVRHPCRKTGVADGAAEHFRTLGVSPLSSRRAY